MSTTNKKEQHSQVLKQENELKNESKYVSLFKDIITRHYQQLLTFDNNSNNNMNNSNNYKNKIKINEEDMQHYKHETTILKNILSIHRQATFFGIGIGIATFGSIRYLPNYIVYKIGNQEKIKKLKQAQEQSKKLNIIRRSIVPTMLEIAFSIFIGFAGYKKTMESNSNKEDVFHDIAKCPLVEGRSLLSERMCHEWLHVAYYNKDVDSRIPPLFWKNVHESKVKDVSTWKNIEYFARNCLKRDAYEKQLLLLKSSSARDIKDDDRVVVIPPPGVPEDILSEDEINAMTTAIV